ncbi:nitroreductase family protein [Flavihumibacter petaseus]|uniref:Putative NAD(P)H nitroreductase n=1 Tax=Flavihumibacter petaseus NBRC 106054 TaxID=1220578 RepID=A0A0E9MXJ7_9BACT|nr:nitroreductase [Flavihumibacter petaseus]GAO42228.1 putative oxidoreductase [Flavihumibacter petaseus NBRC 106054]
MNENNKAALVSEVIRERRSTKPASLNGKPISDEEFRAVIEMADWAPTHGHTEPWLFLIHSGDKGRAFCQAHADTWKEITPAERFTTATYDKLKHMGDLASHVVVAVMKRGDNPKIPLIEEISAAAAATQNVLLAATAHGISSFWSTGGLAHNPALKTLLQLGEHDIVLGILYFGYSDAEPANGKRLKPLSEKFVWS